MKKLIRQIRSFGSPRGVLVCMLPRWQKPKGAFKAPTYTIGGSDSSRTRQGGINLIFELVSMVFMLFGEKFHIRGNNTCGSVYTGYLIDCYEKITLNPKVFSTPKVLFKP